MLILDDRNQFIFTPENENEARQAHAIGFVRNPSGVYTTKNFRVAAGLRAFAKDKAKRFFDQLFLSTTPWPRPLPRPAKPHELKPHQKKAAQFALERNRSYLALEPGLGKTLCAITVVLARKRPCLYICPPFLVENVREEFARFAPQLTTDVYQTNRPIDFFSDVIIMPDTLVWKHHAQELIGDFLPNKMIAVIDEAHRFKNLSAKRSRCVFDTVKNYPYQIYMSGTPAPNRPVELYPFLQRAAWEVIDFMAYEHFGNKYCLRYLRDPDTKEILGSDYNGAKNLADLSKRLKRFMLIIKKDVLDLPPKTESVFVISGKLGKELDDLENVLKAKYHTPEDLIKGDIASGDTHPAMYRKLLGIHKVKFILDYLKNELEKGGENFLIFARHRDVIDSLVKGLEKFRPFVIDGRVKKELRHQIVKDFQAPGHSRPIIGNYEAMGVGLTLTKANRVFFAEFDWVPGVNSQAADRAHRIGQNKNVLVQYAAFKDSLDMKILQTCLLKQKAINQL